MLTRSGLLAGAAAMALAGAAAAQDITQNTAQDAGEPAPPTAADIEGPQAAAVEQDIGEADRDASDEAMTRPGASAPEPLEDAEVEGAEAAVVEEEVEATADAPAAPREEAVEELLDDAQEEALQNDVHILPTRVHEDEIRPWHLWAGEDEGAGAADMRAFMALDRDGDLLLSESEWDAAAPGRADFEALDINSSGEVGFAEYRVWLALREAESANDNETAAGGPLGTPDEPESADQADSPGPVPGR